jgi:hypothetical protein
VLTDGRRPRRSLDASVRTSQLSTITDRILTTEFEVLDDGTRRLAEVRLRMYTHLLTRSWRRSAVDADLFCESFRYTSETGATPSACTASPVLPPGRVSDSAVKMAAAQRPM